MTAESVDAQGEWRVSELTADGAEVMGMGRRFVLSRKEQAAELAELLNAQAAALAEAARLARRYDCGKTTLQKAAMVPCLNLPDGEQCYACEIARARYERNSFCICDDDDELPAGPAEYCPVHGNTYRYVLQEQSRLVETSRARDAAEARAQRLEEALRRIAGMAGDSGAACAEVAREALA